MRLREPRIRILQRKPRCCLPLRIQSFDHLPDICLIICLIQYGTSFIFNTTDFLNYRLARRHILIQLINDVHVYFVSLLIVVSFQYLMTYTLLRCSDSCCSSDRFLENITQISIQVVIESSIQECEGHEREGLGLDGVENLNQVLNDRPNLLRIIIGQARQIIELREVNCLAVGELGAREQLLLDGIDQDYLNKLAQKCFLNFSDALQFIESIVFFDPFVENGLGLEI